MHHILPLLILLAAAGSVAAADNIRIDFSTKDGTALTEFSTVCGTGKISTMAWVSEEKRKGSLWSGFAVPVKTWTQVGFTCTPAADCEATLTLLGPWVPKPGGDGKALEPVVALYDDVTAEGAAILNGGFEEVDAVKQTVTGWFRWTSPAGKDNPGKDVTEGVHGGTRATQGWAASSVSQQVKLAAGKPVTIRLWAWSEADPAAK